MKKWKCLPIFRCLPKRIFHNIGITGGYQFKLAENWNMDIYAGIGTSQDFYKGYVRSTGARYDVAEGFNKSGEILPYRGGVMISYKLK
jgi:hypothetical protein